MGRRRHHPHDGSGHLTTPPQRRLLLGARLPAFLRRRLGGQVLGGSHNRWQFAGLYRFHGTEFSGTTSARYPRHRTRAEGPDHRTRGPAAITYTTGVEE